MSKTIFLDVQVPVYFEVRLGCVFPFYIPAPQVGSHNRTAIVKQDATLVCNAFGDQPISIVWRKVGVNNDALYEKKPIALYIRGADRFTATQKGFPLSKPTPPQA